MDSQIHTVYLNFSWKLINEISEVDRFDASWSSIEKREGEPLKHLKSTATVRSVGASTRIEGSTMSDSEVEALLKNISKLEDRDSQEVVGYFEILDLISASFADIEISENSIKSLHNTLMKYSEKDQWHKGDYKKHSNSVEATTGTGEKYTIFETTPPGFPTEDAMRRLIEWYHLDNEPHPLVKIAIFVYDFLSIHPFQDGNGRISRLLGSLLLLKQGYNWIQYISFEHEIENRKTEYYKELMQAQRQRPGENVYNWVIFFLDCLDSISKNLMNKIERKGSLSQLGPKEKKVLHYIEGHAGCRSSEISLKVDVPLPTVKRILKDLLLNKIIIKHGAGAGSNYSV